MSNIGERNDINEEKSFMEFNTICFDIANFMAKSNNESHNRKKSGSGLGLNIVKQISEIINAKISVESVVDQGTKFTIKLNKKG